ncbi:MAG: hypothetical protein ACJAS4_002391 [Bacteriovoracaceae bacterium]|jgi:hypothetical protein
MINYFKACLWACLFFSQFSNAKLIKDDHYVIDTKEYTWEEVCKVSTKRASPLIEFSTISHLDCMGTKVAVVKFCDEVEASNPYFTRALVSKTKRKVICQSAKRVIVKWECEGKDDRFCKDIEIGCFLFKEKLARRLKLVHKSLTENKYLNCYFDTQKNELEFNL